MEKVYNQSMSLLIAVFFEAILTLALDSKVKKNILLLTCYLAPFTHGCSLKFGNLQGKTRQHAFLHVTSGLPSI